LIRLDSLANVNYISRRVAQWKTQQSPESIIDLIMQYFYDDNEPITTQELFDILSRGRKWLKLSNLRCSIRDIQRKSPPTLARVGGSAKHGYRYKYSGTKYDPGLSVHRTSMQQYEAQREAEAPLRASIVRGKW